MTFYCFDGRTKFSMSGALLDLRSGRQCDFQVNPEVCL